MTAAEIYERVRATCCDESGLTEDQLETHIRAITMLILQVRGQL